jgi:hypothetical protein
MVVSKSFARRRLRFQPGEASLDDPAARMDYEVDLISGLANDFDGDARSLGDALGSIGGVCKGTLDKGKAAAGGLQ